MRRKRQGEALLDVVECAEENRGEGGSGEVMSKSITELREMSEQQLIDTHDELAATTEVGINYYLEELRSRKMAAYARRMDRLTAGIFWMTLIVTLATLVNVTIFILG